MANAKVDSLIGRKAAPGATLVTARPRRGPLPASSLSARPTSAGEHTEIYLLGLGSLGRYLKFIEDAVVREPGSDMSGLTAEWRDAVAHYQELEVSEAGSVLQGSHRELDPVFAPLAARLQSQQAFRRTFDVLPTSFGMVELDRLIVHQPSVAGSFVDALRGRVGSAPTPETLFDLCLSLDAPAAPVTVQRIGPRRFVFSSDSTQLSAGEPAVLPVDPSVYQPGLETISSMVGLGIGFGPNFLNVVRVGRRHLLNNGYHRACALRALGVTHVPCVIQQATHVEDLQIVAGRRVAAEAEFFLESARPPMLMDFFNPRLRKVLPVRRPVQRIEVSIEVNEFVSYE